MVPAVLLTLAEALAPGLKLAVLAPEVFLLGLFFGIKLLLAVGKTTEVGLLAVVALEEGARVKSQLEGLSVVDVAWSVDSLSTWKALILGNLQSELLNLLLLVLEVLKLCNNFRALSLVDLSLAGRALHESEVNLEGAPLVLEQLEHAVCVENVTAGQLNTRLILELTRVADGAKFISTLLKAFVLPAARLEAGQALLLAVNTVACVPTRFPALGALLDTRLLILLNLALIQRTCVRGLGGGCSQ